MGPRKSVSLEGGEERTWRAETRRLALREVVATLHEAWGAMTATEAAEVRAAIAAIDAKTAAARESAGCLRSKGVWGAHTMERGQGRRQMRLGVGAASGHQRGARIGEAQDKAASLLATPLLSESPFLPSPLRFSSPTLIYSLRLCTRLYSVHYFHIFTLVMHFDGFQS